MTKGKMIKALKQIGIRKSIKHTGAEVKLEHLKFPEVCNLYYSFVQPIK